MRAWAHDVQPWIVEGDNELPHFARASQNIAAAVALVQGLPEPATPEERRAHREIHMLLERAVVQQAESSMSRRREPHASQRAPSAERGKDISVHHAPYDGRGPAIPPIQERVGPISDARVVLDARRRRRDDRGMEPTTAITLVAAGATAPTRIGARDPHRRGLRLSAGISFARRFHSGTAH